MAKKKNSPFLKCQMFQKSVKLLVEILRLISKAYNCKHILVS